MRSEFNIMPNGTHKSECQRGIVLIEVLVAVLIFSIGVLAVIGLQAGAAAAVADAKYRVDASSVADRLIGVLWANQSAAASSSGSVSELPSGSFVQTVTPIKDPLDSSSTIGYAATVTVSWQPPNTATAHKFSAVASTYSR